MGSLFMFSAFFGVPLAIERCGSEVMSETIFELDCFDFEGLGSVWR